MKGIGITAAGVAAALVLGVAGTANGNLVVNGGFETGDLTGWDALGPAVSVFSQPHTGDFAVQFSAGGNSLLSQTFDVTPGATYLVEMWIYNGGVGEDLLNLSWQTEEGSVILINQSPLEIPLESWTYVSFETESGASPWATLAFIGTDEISAYFIDDISVTLVPAPAGLAAFALAGLFGTRRRRN